MNIESIKDFFSNLSLHDLPAGGAVVGAIAFIVLAFRGGKAASRILFLLVAIGLVVGAWWWHQHK